MRASIVHFSLVLAVSVPLVACSSGDGASSPEKTPSPADQKPDDQKPDDQAPGSSLLAKPADGVQISALGTDVGPGADVEYCEVAEFPGEAGKEYFVNHVELAKAPYSHHLFVAAIEPGSPAEATANALGVGNHVDCVSVSTTFGEGASTIGGAAKERTDIRFPDGIGQKYIGAQKMVLDYHYFNTSEETVHANVAANFHLVDEAHVRKLARGYSSMHVGFAIPPLGHGSATAQCVFNHDVLVAGIQRHTHRLGTDYTVWSVKKDEKGNDDATELWKSTDWQEDITKTFDEPVLVKAGEGYRYRCDWENDQARTITFGTKATDEMCNLFAAWWVVNEDDEVGPQSCVVFAPDADGVARGVAGDNPAAPISG